MSYALATGLKGFRSSALRVRVTERRDGHVWCVTADLCDAGTRLVLDAAQVIAFPEAAAPMRHASGLVWLGA